MYNPQNNHQQGFWTLLIWDPYGYVVIFDSHPTTVHRWWMTASGAKTLSIAQWAAQIFSESPRCLTRRFRLGEKSSHLWLIYGWSMVDLSSLHFDRFISHSLQASWDSDFGGTSKSLGGPIWKTVGHRSHKFHCVSATSSRFLMLLAIVHHFL